MARKTSSGTPIPLELAVNFMKRDRSAVETLAKDHGQDVSAMVPRMPKIQARVRNSDMTQDLYLEKLETPKPPKKPRKPKAKRKPGRANKNSGSGNALIRSGVKTTALKAWGTHHRDKRSVDKESSIDKEVLGSEVARGLTASTESPSYATKEHEALVRLEQSIACESQSNQVLIRLRMETRGSWVELDLDETRSPEAKQKAGNRLENRVLTRAGWLAQTPANREKKRTTKKSPAVQES